MESDAAGIIGRLKQANDEKLRGLIQRLKGANYIKDDRFERAALKVRVEDFIPFDLVSRGGPDEFFDSFYMGYGQPSPFYYPDKKEWRRSTSAFHMIAIMIQLLDVEAGDEIIVLGAKSGFLECIIAEMAENVHVTVIEALDDVARITRDNVALQGYATRISVLRVDDPIAEVARSGAASVNKILITGTIPSLPAEIRRILKPNGFVLAPVTQKGKDVEVFYKITNVGGAKGLDFEGWGTVSFSPLIRLAAAEAAGAQNLAFPEIAAAIGLTEQFAKKYERLKQTIQKSKEFSFSYLYAYDTGSNLLNIDLITDAFLKEVERAPLEIACTQDLKSILARQLHLQPSYGCEDLKIEFFPVARLGLFASISKIEFEVATEARHKIEGIINADLPDMDPDRGKPVLKGKGMRFQVNMYFMISASGIIICNFEVATLNISWPAAYYYEKYCVDVLRAVINVFEPEKNVSEVLLTVLDGMYRDPAVRTKLGKILARPASLRFKLDPIVFEEYLPNEVLTIPVKESEFDAKFSHFKGSIASPRFDHKFMEKYNFGITGNLDILYFIAATEEEYFQDLTYSSNIAYLRILSDYVFLHTTSERLYKMTKSSFDLLRGSMKLVSLSKNALSNHIEALKEIELGIMQRFYQLDVGFLIEDYGKIAAIA
ncbi:MAG: hypothetical protein JW839_03980, partial [Candidatus Lokiarchaeota archaeon]|nr:hypothetical protein [Candidatus Lokiarchaeota archaeon]